jgi:hypothetical protein
MASKEVFKRNHFLPLEIKVFYPNPLLKVLNGHQVEGKWW